MEEELGEGGREVFSEFWGDRLTGGGGDCFLSSRWGGAGRYGADGQMGVQGPPLGGASGEEGADVRGTRCTQGPGHRPLGGTEGGERARSIMANIVTFDQPRSV